MTSYLLLDMHFIFQSYFKKLIEKQMDWCERFLTSHLIIIESVRHFKNVQYNK